MSRPYATGTISCRGCERDLPLHEYDDPREPKHNGLCRRCDPVLREHDDRVFRLWDERRRLQDRLEQIEAELAAAAAPRAHPPPETG